MLKMITLFKQRNLKFILIFFSPIPFENHKTWYDFKLWFFNSCIFTTKCRRPLIFLSINFRWCCIWTWTPQRQYRSYSFSSSSILLRHRWINTQIFKIMKTTFDFNLWFLLSFQSARIYIKLKTKRRCQLTRSLSLIVHLCFEESLLKIKTLMEKSSLLFWFKRRPL